MTRLRQVLAAVAVAGVAAAALAFGSTPANAAGTSYPSSMSSCAKNSQVGRTNVYQNTVNLTYGHFVYVGWVEERYSSNGSCAGEQWAIFHIATEFHAQVNLGHANSESIYLNPVDGVSNNTKWSFPAHLSGHVVTIYPGSYTTPMFKVWSKQLELIESSSIGDISFSSSSAPYTTSSTWSI